MSRKERPFKTYRSPDDRPFKNYKPGGSLLFQDIEDGQPFSLTGGGKMQQEQQLEQSQLQLHLPQQPQQTYGHPDDFTRLNPNPIQAAAMLGLESNMSNYYEELGLDDPDTSLMRPDMLVGNDGMLQQRDIDLSSLNMPSSISNLNIPSSINNLNIPSSINNLNIPSSTSLTPTSNMMFANRSVPKGGSSALGDMSMHDSLSMLLEQHQSLTSNIHPHLPPSASMAPKNMSHNGGIDMTTSPTLSVEANTTMANSYPSMSIPMQRVLPFIPSHLNGGRNGTSGNHAPPIDVDAFSVKQEADEGSSSPPEERNNTNSIQHSPLKSDNGLHRKELFSSDNGLHRKDQFSNDNGLHRKDQFSSENGLHRNDQFSSDNGLHRNDQFSSDNGHHRNDQFSNDNGLHRNDQFSSDNGLHRNDPSPRGIKRQSPDSSDPNIENKPSTSSHNGHFGEATSGSNSCDSHENTPTKNENDIEDENNKDPAYLEKRRKNNESAKRSREARRSKEEMVALRVVTLEEENMKLRAEASLLEKELDELRRRLYLHQ